MEYLPGTRNVVWWIDHLTGGITPDMVDVEGGPVQFALAIADTGCCCEEQMPDPDHRYFEPYVATCLACEAQSLLRAIAGQRPEEVEFNEVRYDYGPWLPEPYGPWRP